MDIMHLNESDFEREVLESKTPVVVDFWAQWCGPCRMLAPELEQLAKDHPEIRVAKVDVDSAPDLARRYCVTSIPLVVKFVNGKPQASSLGLTTKGELEAKLGL